MNLNLPYILSGSCLLHDSLNVWVYEPSVLVVRNRLSEEGMYACVRLSVRSIVLIEWLVSSSPTITMQFALVFTYDCTYLLYLHVSEMKKKFLLMTLLFFLNTDLYAIKIFDQALI